MHMGSIHYHRLEMSVEVGKKVCNGMADLHHEDCKKQQMEFLFYKNRSECWEREWWRELNNSQVKEGLRWRPKVLSANHCIFY